MKVVDLEMIQSAPRNFVATSTSTIASKNCILKDSVTFPDNGFLSGSYHFLQKITRNSLADEGLTSMNILRTFAIDQENLMNELLDYGSVI